MVPRTFIFLMVAGILTTFASRADAEPTLPPDSRIMELEERIRALETRTDDLQEEVDAIVLRNKYRLAQLGVGLSMPMFGADYSDTYRMRVHGKLRMLHAFYYPKVGGGAAVELPLALGPVTLRPLGLGVMAYHHMDQPLTTRWLNRRFDVVVPVGVDFRVWNGMTLSAQASWFLPNPFTVSKAASAAGAATGRRIIDRVDRRDEVSEACIDLWRQLEDIADQVPDAATEEERNALKADLKAKLQNNCRSEIEVALDRIEEVDLDRLKDIPRDAKDVARRAYIDAWKEPRIEFLFSWSF